MDVEIYELLRQQNEDLAGMVSKYQCEIIPQFEKALDMARVEREALIKATAKVSRENEALLGYVKTLRRCNACKHLHGHGPDICPGSNCSRCKEDCACTGCDDLSKWEWEGPKETGKGGRA